MLGDYSFAKPGNVDIGLLHPAEKCDNRRPVTSDLKRRTIKLRSVWIDSLNSWFGNFKCNAEEILLLAQMNAASAIAATAPVCFARDLRVRLRRIERAVGSGCPVFHLNGWYGEFRCAAKYGSLHLRGNVASAICQTPMTASSAERT